MIEGLETGLSDERITFGACMVGRHHFADQFVERDLRRPAQFHPCLGRIAEEGFNLGRAIVARVDADNGVSGGAGHIVAVDPLDNANFGFTVALESQGDAEF